MSETEIKIKAISDDNIQAMKSKFLCCSPNITRKDILKFAEWEDQKLLLDSTVLCTLNKSYPIKRSYQIAFLKNLINGFETSGCEVHDSIYEELCRLQGLSEDIAERSYKHYLLTKADIVFSLRESKSFVSNGTTGLCTWQASLALSNWILNNPQILEGKRVIELGSGTGLLGFIASRCCRASQVILTDGSLEVWKLLNENLKRNFKLAAELHNEPIFKLLKYDEREIGTLLLKWEDVQSSAIDEITEPDVILAADVVYDQSIFHPLADTLEYIFDRARNKCILLLASTIRNETTLRDFYNVLEERNFVLDRRKALDFEDNQLHCDGRVEIAYVHRSSS